MWFLIAQEGNDDIIIIRCSSPEDAKDKLQQRFENWSDKEDGDVLLENKARVDNSSSGFSCRWRIVSLSELKKMEGGFI